jgi:hypothetical protein
LGARQGERLEAEANQGEELWLVNDQWIPGPPSKPPTWTVNPLPPSNAWDQTEGCAAESGPAIVEGITITGVPATVSSLYWQVSLNDGSSPPNFQINALDGAGNFVSTAAEISPTTINLDYPVLLSRDPVEPMEPVTLEYLTSHPVGIPDAPDNQTYGRTEGAWNLVVPAAGGTFTGATNLSAGGAVTSGALLFAGNAVCSLPTVAQLEIGGGSLGQVPATDGNGHLSWVTPVTGGPYLPLSGGTITGSLTVNQVLTVQGPNSLVLNAPLNNPRAILAQAAGITRWLLNLGDQTNEGLNNVGANFSLQAYSTTGVSLGTWLTIARADGATVFNGTGITVNGGLAVNGLLAVNSLGNFYLPGGSAGQFLSTNGSGLLSWATPAGGGGGIPEAPTDGRQYGRQSTAWTPIVGGGASIGDTAPASPVVGQLWWDSVHGQMYVWFTDANSSQWVPTTNQMGGGYLPLSGGSLTGNLVLASQIEVDGAGASPIGGLPGGGGAAIRLNKGASGGNSVINSYTNGSVRWQLYLGNSVAESGSNAGSDFYVINFNDTGAQIGTPIGIIRATGAVNIYGTSTNDNAQAGYVGEVIQANQTAGSIANNTPANLTSIALTPGDWDVSAEVWFTPSISGAMTGIWAAISNVSGVLPNAIAINTSRAQFILSTGAFTLNSQIITPRTCRVSLAASATYYLVVQATFSSGSLPVQGLIWARRAR